MGFAHTLGRIKTACVRNSRLVRLPFPKMARPNADVDEGDSSFVDMRSFMHALPILPESRPSAPASTEAHSTSLASTIGMAHTTEAPGTNSLPATSCDLKIIPSNIIQTRTHPWRNVVVTR